jgi:peptidoglycan/LPS O-acetylase OafA/YrhL
MLSDLDFRSNAIGFLRLFFAGAVLWSHAYGIGGFGYDPIGQRDHGLIAGLLAVGGFFVLSGLLITRSYETVNNSFRFVWHRVLRIFPAFWVCLVVTAFVFAPIAYAHERGTLVGFFSRPESPFTYITRNALLLIVQPDIRRLLAHLPGPLNFNGSLWTLIYEFCCYLAVAVLGIVGIIRRSPYIVAVLSIFLYVAYCILIWRYGGDGVTIGTNVFSLAVYFAFGSSAYLLRDRIPMRSWLATICAIALAVALPTRIFPVLAIPCVSYLTLFAAMRLPLRNLDRHIDLSYGLYIYAFPIQQMLALFGIPALGLAQYVLISLVIALVAAAASWMFIERPSLALKSLRLGQPAPAPATPGVG